MLIELGGVKQQLKNAQQKQSAVPDMTNIKELVKYGVNKHPDNKYLIFHNDKNEECSKTFKDIWNDISGFGTFLSKYTAAQSKVAILGENSYEWVVTFFSVFLGRNVLVPLDRDLPAEDLAEQLISSGCSVLVYSKTYQRDIEYFKTSPGMTIEHYFSIENFNEYISDGTKALKGGYCEFVDQEVTASDLASIVYTSGTTGKSKGVMLTHGNLMANVVATCRCLSGEQTVLFLPFNHTFAWASLFAGFVFSENGYICTDYRNIVNNFKDYCPQHFMAVPLVIEKIYKTIWRTAEKTEKAALLRKGIKINRFLLKFGIDKRRKMFKEVHDNLGGKLELIICGGAALDKRYEEDLYHMGILVLNGYGITECSPVVAANRLDVFRLGSMGLPLPCNEIKIVEPDEDGVGEIYVRGANVFVGYYDDPQATAQAFDGDWFKTGDYGRIDKDGFLFFVGRKKNRIVLSNGKNISPEELEDKLMKIPFVKEVVVYAEKTRIAAEFYLNENGFSNVRQELEDAVHDLNKNMPLYKHIAEIKIRETEFPKTTTLKIKREYN